MLMLGLAVALVVGLGAGGAIGWKVEQNRIKDNSKKKALTQSQNVRPFGVVTAVSDNSVTVQLQTGAAVKRTFTITRDTTVDRGVAGRASDVVEGATVLVRTGNSGGAKPLAVEIVVLPKSTTFGKG